MKSFLRIVLGELLVGLIGILIVGALVAWYAGGELIAPVPRYIGHPPRDLSVANATFVNGAGSLIHGWVAHGNAGRGVVLLLHGLHGDRRDMIERAEFLSRLGYSVLLIDFEAHGESRGEHVSFGVRESRDVAGALQYLHYMFPHERVGVIAASLGAAAFVLADKRPAVDAVVLESLYPSLQQAVAARVRVHVGPLAYVIAPLMAMQVRARLAIQEDRTAIREGMAHIGAPLLMLSATRDPDAPLAEERSLYAAASPPKEFWAVEGAANVDLYEFAKADYERRIAAFLAAHLASQGNPAVADHTADQAPH